MKKIPITGKYALGRHALVDDTDYEKVISMSPWHATKQGYAAHTQFSFDATGKKKFKTVFMHRLIIGGNPSDGIIDHKNRDTFDNRKTNLRLATHGQNRINSTEGKNNTSGYRGVTKYRNKWKAQIKFDKKHYYLGVFESPVVAALIFNIHARALHGEFAYQNKLPTYA